MAIRLKHREKYAVWLLAIFVGLFAVAQFVVFPLIDEKERLDRAIQAKTKVIADVRSMKAEYETILRYTASAQQHFENREKGFTLFSFLDHLAGMVGVKDQITYMKPSTTLSPKSKYKIFQVEMKFRAVTMNRLIPYLQMVETSKNAIVIRRLSITKTDKPKGFVNAVLQVETSGPK